MPSHRHGSASNTPSPTARTGGPCNAGPAAANTCPRPSPRSAPRYPTAPQPGSPPPPGNHPNTPGNDVPNAIAHLLLTSACLALEADRQSGHAPGLWAGDRGLRCSGRDEFGELLEKVVGGAARLAENRHGGVNAGRVAFAELAHFFCIGGKLQPCWCAEIQQEPVVSAVAVVAVLEIDLSSRRRGEDAGFLGTADQQVDSAFLICF